MLVSKFLKCTYICELNIGCPTSYSDFTVLPIHDYFCFFSLSWLWKSYELCSNMLLYFLQNPADGYYRVPYPGPIDTNIHPVVLIGEIRSCECNDHSNKCHPESGVCYVSSLLEVSTLSKVLNSLEIIKL